MHRFYLQLYFCFLLSVTLTTICTERILSFYFEARHREQVLRENQEISRGCFYLLDKELQNLDEPALSVKVRQLQPEFGYPISVLEKSSLNLNADEERFFSQGLVFYREKGNLLLRRLTDGDKIMVMGPFSEVISDITDNVVALLTVTLLLAIFSLTWAYYFWRQLSTISKAARAFGDGDLSARAKTGFLSPIAAIAKVFNSMAERIEQLISARKELLNAVSHELRTPLSRLRFGLERIYRADPSERGSHFAGMHKDIDELEELVAELLSYTKLEHHGNHAAIARSPLLPWIKELLVLAREMSHVPIAFTSSGLDHNSLVPYDPRLLERALHNLLQNADRFAATEIVLSLAATPGEIVLTVADDGPGIAEEDRERIFDPFVRLDSSRNRECGGYGLGLAIVKQIARCHGGQVVAKPSSGGGAALEMRWPRVLKGTP